MINTEQLRQRYRPKEIKVLFVVESQPASGTFFYAGNSNLFRSTQKAFEIATGKRWESPESFLKFFMEEGCYLDDLCQRPVNSLALDDRLAACKEGVEPLAARILEYKPQLVIVMPKSISDHVRKALAPYDRSVPFREFPFPSLESQQAYVDELSTLLLPLYV